MELGHLALKRPGHWLLAQTLAAAHFGFYQRLSVVAAPSLPDSPHRPPTRLDRFIVLSKCPPFAQLGSFAWRDHWNGFPQVTRLMDTLRVECPIASVEPL